MEAEECEAAVKCSCGGFVAVVSRNRFRRWCKCSMSKIEVQMYAGSSVVDVG